jgi:N utilization substance protein A
LFEQEIPEIAEGVIAVDAMSREPGYRSKVAVSSKDQRVDCVGACVGVRGNRIKNIVDELSGERIDIVRWSEDPEVLIPNALQPAEVDQVLLCDMLGRAIVLVREDQLSLAIGRRGQNVRLASKLCGWDIEIMTSEELEEQIDRAVAGFSALDGVEDEVAQRLVEQGYLSYDDLSVIEPDALMEMGDLTAEQVDHIVEQAEQKAEEAERAAAEERRRQKEQEQLEGTAAAAGPPASDVSASPDEAD